MKAAILGLLMCILALPSYAQLTTQPLVPQLQPEIDIDHLKHGNPKQQKTALFGLHEAGLDALQLLIESIDDTEPFDQVRLANPILSYLPPEALKKTYVDVLSAYTVELILGREVLRGKPSDYNFLVDHENCVYAYGVLKRSGESIDQKDLKRIKKIYEKWWEAHKGITLEQLRQEWSNNRRPLTGSPYNWF